MRHPIESAGFLIMFTAKSAGWIPRSAARAICCQTFSQGPCSFHREQVLDVIDPVSGRRAFPRVRAEVVIRACGVLTGFSWEHTFHMAVEMCARGSCFRLRSVYKLCFAYGCRE